MTAVLATLFFLTSLGLSYLFSRGGEAPSSVMDRAPVQEAPVDPTAIQAPPAQAPAAPASDSAAPSSDQAAPPSSDQAAPATEPAPAPTNE